MTFPLKSRKIWFLVFLILTACQRNQPPEPPDLILTSSPTVPVIATPTVSVSPTSSSPPPQVTEIPLPTPTSTISSPTFELASQPFTHPDDLFSLLPPLGWAAETNQGTASFTAPNGRDFLTLEVTNTGYPLDPDSFARFVDAREANLFTPYEQYLPGIRQIEETTAFATKTLLFQDTPQTVLTYYLQSGQIILAMDFWTDTTTFSPNEPFIQQIIQSLTLNETAATELDIYSWVFPFTGPANLFTLDIPNSWRPDTALNDLVAIHTFTTPDQYARIQSIAFNDGNTLTLSQAGQFALSLLQRYYASDVEVIGDTRLGDGSERLTWVSEDGGYSGVSFFEVRGTTFLMLTVQWDEAYTDLYRPLLDDLVGSYAVP